LDLVAQPVSNDPQHSLGLGFGYVAQFGDALHRLARGRRPLAGNDHSTMRQMWLSHGQHSDPVVRGHDGLVPPTLENQVRLSDDKPHADDAILSATETPQLE
jgi:hypothetical protein